LFGTFFVVVKISILSFTFAQKTLSLQQDIKLSKKRTIHEENDHMGLRPADYGGSEGSTA
jgi:hypothetical protein